MTAAPCSVFSFSSFSFKREEGGEEEYLECLYLYVLKQASVYTTLLDSLLVITSFWLCSAPKAPFTSPPLHWLQKTPARTE